jgi:hypothetical protein
MTLPGNIDFDNLKPEEFEHILPDLFAAGSGKISQDPRLKKFLAANPDCAALVSDLEIIAETARRARRRTKRPRLAEHSGQAPGRLRPRLHRRRLHRPRHATRLISRNMF